MACLNSEQHAGWNDELPERTRLPVNILLSLWFAHCSCVQPCSTSHSSVSPPLPSEPHCLSACGLCNHPSIEYVAPDSSWIYCRIHLIFFLSPFTPFSLTELSSAFLPLPILCPFLLHALPPLMLLSTFFLLFSHSSDSNPVLQFSAAVLCGMVSTVCEKNVLFWIFIKGSTTVLSYNQISSSGNFSISVWLFQFLTSENKWKATVLLHFRSEQGTGSPVKLPTIEKITKKLEQAFTLISD